MVEVQNSLLQLQNGVFHKMFYVGLTGTTKQKTVANTEMIKRKELKFSHYQKSPNHKDKQKRKKEWHNEEGESNRFFLFIVPLNISGLNSLVQNQTVSQRIKK